MFRPARLVVAPGTTIVWTNGGQVIHTVTAEDGSFDSGAIESGQRRAVLFAKPGTFPFQCCIEEGAAADKEHGRLVVVE